MAENGKPAKTRRGRPEIPAADRLSRRIELRLTEAEYCTLTQASARAGVSVSAYIRRAIR